MLLEPGLKSLKKIYQGKVRDIYEVDDKHWLIVASDRISAFDVVLPDLIPKKGIALTAVSNFWFNRFDNQVSNHLSNLSLEAVIKDEQELRRLDGRSVVVQKLKALPFEAIVRGYIIGSGWKEYQKTGMISGVRMPENLQLAKRLAEPVFTPSTKARVGEHDVNIHFDKVVNLVGKDIAEHVREISLQIYTRAAEYALQRNIIMQNEFEFGWSKHKSS